ncbi:MAG: prepilin-type N-terminal cleavage/methylation domain-containing protein [Candidatus Dadabacteria bacterium]|nr:MAG: prepilin-type N-terminal cleavage/methylation domain-containing protein [Candidatus Dadabacteria bacterium]TDI99192.1 MAG: prepilin-type N-terminal cleavage/methylation domain-containing protein [Candidatus Dadabacteria bacterium]
MKGTRYLPLQQQSQTTNKGFTLIEVLLAVFIASIVLTVLYASFFQILKAKEKVEEELELYHETRVIFSKMTKDLVTAFPRGIVNSDSSNLKYPFFIGSEDGNNSSLTFTSLSRRPAKGARESDQTEISYFLEPAEDTPDLFVLIRRDNPTIGTDGGGAQYPISERIVRFKVSYLGNTSIGNDNQELEFEWNSNETSSLPTAVNVNLTIRSPRGEDIEFNSLIIIPVVD